MKHFYKLFLLLSISIFSHADGYEYTCTGKWISYQNDDKLYEVPNVLKVVHITFVDNKLDTVKFRTNNQSSYYDYINHLRSANGGLVYKADNGNRLAMHYNSEMTIVIPDKATARFICPKVRISGEKINR